MLALSLLKKQKKIKSFRCIAGKNKNKNIYRTFCYRKMAFFLSQSFGSNFSHPNFRDKKENLFKWTFTLSFKGGWPQAYFLIV